jgi:hypothetical protein
MFSRQQVAELMGIKDQLASAGVTAVAVGSGTPEQARMFVEKFNFEGEMYVDPDLHTYRAFDLVRGLLRTLGPASLMRGMAAIKKGFRQGRTAGDPWQQGGLFVMGPGRQLIFQHRNRFAGDHANMNAVLKAVLSPANP